MNVTFDGKHGRWKMERRTSEGRMFAAEETAGGKVWDGSKKGKADLDLSEEKQTASSAGAE